jgi:hypothetical protein
MVQQREILSMGVSVPDEDVEHNGSMSLTIQATPPCFPLRLRPVIRLLEGRHNAEEALRVNGAFASAD